MTDLAHPLADALTPAREARARGDLPAALAVAQALLDAPATDAALRTEAGLMACLCHYRLGQLAALLAVGEPLLPHVDPDTRPAERAELLRWLTLSAAEVGRFALAMRCATEQSALADRRGDPAAQALALNALGTCFERMGDPWQAERLMRDALDHALRQPEALPRMMTLNNLSAVTIGAYHLLRDVADDEARAAIARAADYAARARVECSRMDDPFARVFVDGNAGEALLHLGRHDEAAPLLDGALALALAHGHHAQGWRIRCTQAEGLLARHRPAEARAALHGLLQQHGVAMPQATLLRFHHTLYRAARALDLADEALVHLEFCDRLQRTRSAMQLRGQSELLVTRVEAERARQDARTAEAHAAEQARHARQDALTGLTNRRGVDERLPALLATAAGQGRPLALALIDIDHFKQVNDQHGHRRGDAVLVALSRLLGENIRQADLLARLGGEEFLVVLPDIAEGQALATCERLREQVARHDWGAIAPGLAITVSIGLAQLPPHEPATLFEHADRALYRAKHGGRNRVCPG